MSGQDDHDIELQSTDNPMNTTTTQSISLESVSHNVEPRKVNVLGVTFEDHKDSTLKEKLAYMKRKIENDEEIDGDLPNEKGKRPFDIKAKYRKIMHAMMKTREEKSMQDEIVAFKYATDMSILRRCTPEEVWQAVKRRAAWSQTPQKMIGVTAAQIVLCLICLLTNNSPINASTSLMAAIYIATVCASNSFVKCGDVTNYICHFFGLIPPRKKDQVAKPNYPAFIAFLIFGFPIIAFVYAVAVLLDICIGEIVDLSYGELFNVLTNVIVIFTGFSVGLRSGNAVGAVQTFAGFSFISEMDEMVMETVDVDLDMKVSHLHGKGKERKILTVRIILYVLTPLFLVFFMWVTFTNTCLAFCSDS